MADFDTGKSEASQTFPAQCSSLRKGGFVIIKDRPCKIVEMSTSKTGKHGHAKVHMVAMDIFTNRKYEDICPSTHNMNVPHVKRKDLQLMDIDGEYLSLLDDIGNTRDDVKLPENNPALSKEIREKYANGDNFNITILEALGEEMVVAFKTLASK